jgi:transcription initiation factor TFIID subunit 6
MLIAGIMKAVTSLSDGSTAMTNGTNGNAADGEALEQYLGKIIGSRVAAIGNHRLNKAILDSREKH